MQDYSKQIDYLISSAKLNGAACATVSDGHVLVLTKDKLRVLLESKEDSEIVVVFVQRNDFKSQTQN